MIDIMTVENTYRIEDNEVNNNIDTGLFYFYNLKCTYIIINI